MNLGGFMKHETSLHIRNFQEINMKLQISEDSELGDFKLGGFTVFLVFIPKKN